MNWHVFYTPHTDDESIGMAGAIVRARQNGSRVLVVLVTDNLPSSYMQRVWGRDDLKEQRRIEFVRAMHMLGVTDLRFWEVEESNVTARPFDVQAEVERKMHELQKELEPTHHHTVWGMYDIHADSGYGSLMHGACANALTRFTMRTPDVRASLYGVYVYAEAMRDRIAPKIMLLDDETMVQKRAALDCYRAGGGSIGYGHRSVSELIEYASVDPREFVMELQ